jgi:hypothetical protein
VSLAQAQELVQQVSASVVLIRERSELVEQGRMKSAGTRRKRGEPARIAAYSIRVGRRLARVRSGLAGVT